MSADLLDQGFRLMFIGMGVVFLYLGVLVGVIKVVSALVLKFEPSDTLMTAAPNKPASASGEPDDDTVAAITTAVHKYRGTQ